MFDEKGERLSNATKPDKRCLTSWKTKVIIPKHVFYPIIETNFLPAGIAKVPVKIIDADGSTYDSIMIAGQLASNVLQTGRDTLQPRSDWLIGLVKNEPQVTKNELQVVQKDIRNEQEDERIRREWEIDMLIEQEKEQQDEEQE